MGSELRWIQEGHVLFSRYYGVVTMDTMRAGASAFVEFLDKTEFPQVHVVYDNTQQTKGPTNLVEIRRVSKPVFEHPKIGWNIVVTPNPLNKFLTSMLMQAYNVHWRAVNSYEEAMKVLQKIDPSLVLASEPPMQATPVVHIEI